MVNEISAPAPPLRRIALIGNSVPRRCGIATFTTHCFEALRASYPDLTIDFYAMDDGLGHLAYPDHVHLIAQHDRTAYSIAAKQIEESGAEAIWLQHEFGIFGGNAGDHLLQLLARTRLPVVTTLHTVLEHPNDDERRVMDAVLARSSSLIVMADRGREILERCYSVSPARIQVIPHGVPDRAYVEPDSMKAAFGWQGHKVVLTFGLLAPDKGIETMIEAMPTIAAAHPDALYIVLGATHPNLIREQGEALRERLIAQASALGVGNQVRFIDSFVEQEELLDYLQAADIYVTPYVNPAQITSGTLSYAVAMGKPVVSTPYVHATEILADDHGKLVPFRNSAALAEAVGALLSDDEARRGYAARAYARGRSMLWSELARRTAALLDAARASRPARLVAKRVYAPLEPDLQAIVRMSDGTGMLQHSIHSIPDRNHGYCIDDNARALILMSQIEQCDESVRDEWMTTYASFIQFAWNDGAGRFRNFMAYDRHWAEDVGSEDSNGRTLWALGITVRDAPFAKHRNWAMALYDRACGPLSTMMPPRARAFSLFGALAVLAVEPGHAVSRRIVEDGAAFLHALWTANRREGWNWFEPRLSYDNMRLPEAMIRAGQALNRPEWTLCGLETLRWAVDIHIAPEGYFRAVGTESFERDYARPLTFDQQPLEAQAAVEVGEAAFESTGDASWADFAETAYAWFLGRNDLDTPLASRGDGGCFDGLTPFGVNRNQGAESLLALQLSSCAINRLSNKARTVAQATVNQTESLKA